MDFPKILQFDSPDVVRALQSIQDIYPKPSDLSFTFQFLEALDIDEFKRKLLSMQTQVILVEPDSLCDDQRSDCRLCVYRVQTGASKGRTLKGEVTATIILLSMPMLYTFKQNIWLVLS